jgi:hypothetical protein
MSVYIYIFMHLLKANEYAWVWAAWGTYHVCVRDCMCVYMCVCVCMYSYICVR